MDATIVFNTQQKLMPPLELSVLSGPEKGKTFPVLGGRQTFGRAPANDIILPDHTISKYHGFLLYDETGVVTFHDAASRNGLVSEGKRASKILLKPGQTIQVGSILLQLSGGSSSGETGLNLMKPVTRSKMWVASLSGYLPMMVAVVAIVLVAGMAFVSLSQMKSALRESQSTPSVSVASVQPVIPVVKKRIVRRSSPRPNPEIQKPAPQVEVVTSPETIADSSSIASKLFEEALMDQVMAPDRAREKLQAVVSMSEPGSEIYQKAQELLSRGG